MTVRLIQARKGEKRLILKTVKNLVVAIIALLLLESCAKKNVFVLLPGPDGKTGRILVSSGGGEQMLTEPKQATTVKRPDALPAKPFPMSDKEIEATCGEALTALPQPPVHFLLYFKSGSTELAEESRKMLDKVLYAVKSCQSTDISVVGHTDRVGSREANFKLGMERTELVRQMLVSQGVDGDYIDTSSHGEDNPVIKTDDEVPEPRNRRVEVVVR